MKRPGRCVLDPKVVVDEVQIRILVVVAKFDRLNRNLYEFLATIRPILPSDNGAFAELESVLQWSKQGTT